MVRLEAFLKEFKQYEKTRRVAELRDRLSAGGSHRPARGASFPTPRAMVADNDLAVGRLVERDFPQPLLAEDGDLH